MCMHMHTHVKVNRQRSTLAFAWLWLRLGATAEAHPADGHLGKVPFLLKVSLEKKETSYIGRMGHGNCHILMGSI